MKKAFSYIGLFLVMVGMVGAQHRQLEWTTFVKKSLVEKIAQNDLAKEIYSEVVEKLQIEGIPAKYVSQIFSHLDIQIDDEIEFRWNHPKEQLPYEEYRKIFITEERISGGKRFYWKHRALIDNITDYYNVDPLMLVSIVGIESKYGGNEKQYLVFNALHTVAHRIPRKEKWAVKEMTEFLKYCYFNHISPLTVFGSYAGAFGYGQFLPSSYNGYAVDFNNDGIIDPQNWSDVLASVANYLLKHGYDSSSRDFSKNSPNWKSIISYNPSENYVKVVLELRKELLKNL